MSSPREGPHRGGFPPVRKSLGQHFLHDQSVLTRIADAALLTGSETVIEIGPGRGALTDILVERCSRLVAIEYDRALASRLVDRYAGRPNVEIVQADVLTCDFGAVAGGPYRLVGNVPYYITTPIIFLALEPPRPDIAVYLMQREVAARLTAPPGGKEYGALTVNVGAVAHVDVLFFVPSTAFRPPPKVESAVVRITPRADPIVPAIREKEFRAFVQATFTMRRKQMQRIMRSLNNLDAGRANAVLIEAGIDPMARPETLDGAAFARLLTTAG